MTYLFIKWLHILSATVLFGTGLGTALHQWLTHKRGDVSAIAMTLRNVVWVDWVFTTTSGVVQLFTGIALLMVTGYDPVATWLLASYLLFLIALACWVPVVWLQIRMRDLAITAAEAGRELPDACYRYMRWWVRLGWPAFLSLILVFWLMVNRPT